MGIYLLSENPPIWEPLPRVEALPTLGPWTGFEPMHLKTHRPPKAHVVSLHLIHPYGYLHTYSPITHWCYKTLQTILKTWSMGELNFSVVSFKKQVRGYHFLWPEVNIVLREGRRQSSAAFPSHLTHLSATFPLCPLTNTRHTPPPAEGHALVGTARPSVSVIGEYLLVFSCIK